MSPCPPTAKSLVSSGTYLVAALALHGVALTVFSAMAPRQRPAETPPALSFRWIESAVAHEPEAPKSAVRPAPAAKSAPTPRRPPAPPLIAPAAEAQARSDVPSDTALPQAEPTDAAPAAVPATATVTATAAHAQTAPRFDADYLDNPAPAYPTLARRMGEEGSVVLRVFVEASGRPGQIQIHSGSGSARLDQAAQESVARWRFVPAQRGGEPIGAWVLVPIQFSLRS